MKILAPLVAGTLALTPTAAPGPAEQPAPDPATFTLQALEEGRITIPGWQPPHPPVFTAEQEGSDAPPYRPEEQPAGPSPVTDTVATVKKAAAEDGTAALVDTATVGDGFMSAAGRGFVDLSWTTRPGVVYDIYRDDALIGSTTTGSFRDTDARPGTFYMYQASPRIAPHENGGPGSAGQIDPNAGTFGFAVNTVSSQGPGLTAAPPIRHDDTRVTFRAFIPTRYIDVKPALNLNCGRRRYFAGDNRGYTIAQRASSRVASEIYAIWRQGKAAQAWWVGETHVLAADKRTVVERRRASRAGTGVWVYHMDRDFGYFQQTLEGANPFCKFGSIYGRIKVKLWATGPYSMHGSHRLMPNIEIYHTRTSRNHSVTRIVRRRDLRSPLCLVDHAPACAESF